MKVVRLELENYRRHRDTRIELADGVTAIVGPNGAGKSTILEAIAFALYGPRAAGTGKDLIRSEGASPGDAVRVSLEFELAGHAVRLVRELRGKAQSPMASLEMDGTLLVQPVAGSSEQATAQVERLLGLDRDGFFQTVVARQRDLDRLGRLKPAERRAFILELAGIGAVDAAIDRARQQRNTLRTQVDEAARHVGDEAALRARLEQARARQATAAQALQAAEAALTEATTSAAHAEARLESARSVAADAAGLERQAEVLAQKHAFLRTDVERLSAEEARAWQAEQQLDALRAAAAPLEELQERIAGAQGLVVLLQQRQALVVRLATQQADLERAEADLATVVVPAPPDLDSLSAALDARQAEAAAAEAALAVAAERVRQGEALVRELNRLDESAPCPACRQPVTGAHLQKERQAAREALGSAQQGHREAAEAAQATRRAAAQAKQALESAQGEARRVEALARRRDLALQRRDGLREAVAATLAQMPPEPKPQGDLADLRRRVAQAETARLDLKAAEQAAAHLPALKQARAKASAQSDQVAAELAALRLRLASMPDAAKALAAAVAVARAAQQEVSNLRQTHLSALLEEQRAAQELQAAARDLERDGQARTRLTALQGDLARWTAVVSPAGDGLLDRFREHLVARMAPAVSREASHLLALFTQGRYTELVLDDGYELCMADQGRFLPLERFSGGEQDLAHLAVRLGISRLLATRSGLPEIRFLALDEVFSSLDRDRCAALLGALQSLGGLYSQILAITHLDTLREAFDAVLPVGLEEGSATVAGHNG
jgi:DNA repair protein SbcC/Rad50